MVFFTVYQTINKPRNLRAGEGKKSTLRVESQVCVANIAPPLPRFFSFPSFHLAVGRRFVQIKKEKMKPPESGFLPLNCPKDNITVRSTISLQSNITRRQANITEAQPKTVVPLSFLIFHT